MFYSTRRLVFPFIALALIAFMIAGCGGGSDSSDSSDLLVQVSKPIGPEGGSIKLDCVEGEPEVIFPAQALSTKATVTLTSLDSHTPPENEDLNYSCPFKMEIKGAAVNPGAFITVNFKKIPVEESIPAVGHYKDDHSLHPAQVSGDTIYGQVLLEVDETRALSKDSAAYTAELAAVDIPVIPEAGQDPPMKIKKLENNRWVSDETGWTGTKIALMVHGIKGSSADLLALAIHLNDGGDYDAIYAVDYQLGYKIDHLGEKLASIIDSRIPAGVKIDIFAHSMGGLVTRSAIENHQSDQHTNIMITMGSPHNGVLAAWLLSLITDKYIPGLVPELDDLAPGSDFLNSLNNGVAVNCVYYTAAGNNGENLTEYWTIKTFGETLVKVLLGSTEVDGMVATPSAAFDISAECSKWETKTFPVSHCYIRGGDEGEELYEDIFTQIDQWLSRN